MLARICRSSRCLGSFRRCYQKDSSARVLPIKRRYYHDTNIPFHSKSSSSNNNDNSLPASSSSFVLYDSLSQSLKEIPLMTPNNNSDNKRNQTQKTNKNKALAWYTCGPTTYSAMHLGHARTYVWFDMMRRVLEWVCAANGAPPPLFVMNITDIDDKIIAAAAQSGEDALTISRRSEAQFWKDMKRLGCQKPHITTRVTDYIDSDIVPYIERLVKEQDMAYFVETDGVYFDVQSFEEKLKGSSQYGKLAGGAVKSSSESSEPEIETNTEEKSQSSSFQKRDRRDFALWKLRKEGEDVFWESPWGQGRPGWHIECSAMIEAVQKQFQDTHTFLVHAGGVDLKFPHHTNEIAQAEAYHYSGDGGDESSCSCPSTHNDEWIPHWVHTGHLMVKDAKMSKSLKNFLTVDELWFDYDKATSSRLDSPADDFRMWCLLGGSYGHREEYSRSKIRGARQKRETILRFLLDGESWLRQQQEKNSVDMDVDGIKIQNSNKRWTEEDHSLLVSIQRASQKAHRALLNNMRGTAYVEGLVKISEAGSAYIRQHDPSEAQIVEHIKVGLQSSRDLLSLVGFSELTVRAGMQKKISDHDGTCSDGTSIDSGNTYIVGGESAVIEEMLNFRAAVRRAALAEVKSKKGADCDSAKDILKACDALRDNLPKIGIEVMDSGKDKTSTWRFCVPKLDEKKP